MDRKESRRFIFTALGAAMGLGNAMRFPGLCYTYGGAFILAYALALAAAYPLLCAEFSLGKSVRAPFPVAIKSVNPRSGAVGWAACLNSALIAAYYTLVIARLAHNSCTFGVGVITQSTGNMPDLTPVFCALCWLALGFLLTRSFRVRSGVARFAVTAQSVLFALLGMRGALYENALSALSVLAVRASDLADPEMWLNALGQALLSLSVAAGVMPSFAADMPVSASPKKCALVVAVANFTCGINSAIALITVAAGCNMSGKITSNGFINALALFPEALAITFKNPVVTAVFGTAFLLSLTLTAAVSALSLLYPLFGALDTRIRSRRDRAFALCAVGAALSLAFAFIPDAVARADAFACNFAAPAIAVAESAVFLHRVLTERRGRDRIYVWKIYSKSKKN